MSEYQYYEFQAIDRPLTQREMQILRTSSERATITPTRFVNHYEWGNFKGNPAVWVEKYFDAFLYVANWGTHELMLRLPSSAFDHKVAKQYLVGKAASIRTKGSQVILEFRSESEDGDGEADDDGSDWLSSLISIRGELASGQLRALYLAWLQSVQLEQVADGVREPPVPPGLGQLDASLTAFAEFLRIDEHLIAAAAECSPDDAGPSKRALGRWIAGLPDSAKTDLLLRCAMGEDVGLRAELLRRFRKDAAQNPRRAETRASRTAGELREAAEARAERASRQSAAREARAEARRAREQATVREKYLKLLARNESATWNKVSALIAATKPSCYDEAIGLLQDLRELGARVGRVADVEQRIRSLRDENSNKPSFVQRLQRAGLLAAAQLKLATP